MIIKWLVTKFSQDQVTKTKKQRLDELSAFLAWPIEEKDRLLIQEKFLYFFKHRYTYPEITYSIDTPSPMHTLLLLKKYSKYVEVDVLNSKVFFKKNMIQKKNGKGILYISIVYILYLRYWG